MTLDKFQNLRPTLIEYATDPKLNLSQDEQAMMLLFVTNISRQVFAFKPLTPAEVAGAVISRASRAKGDLRLVMQRDFLDPLIAADPSFLPTLRSLFTGEINIDSISNNVIARRFFVTWYSAYGDKSIADVVPISFGLSNVSLLTTRLIMQSRAGFSAIEMSGRYLDISKQQKSGEYPFFTPPELKKWGLFESFQTTIVIMLEKFGILKDKYQTILNLKYANDTSVTNQLIRTKVFDDLRHMIPLCIFTQFGLNMSARATEHLIAKLVSANLNEMKFIGASLFEEARQVIPSLMTSMVSQLGLDYTEYMSTHASREKELARQAFFKIGGSSANKDISPLDEILQDGGVRCVDYDPYAEEKIIASIMFKHGLGESFESILATVGKYMTAEMKAEFFDELFADRKFRFYTLSRDFELGDLTFEFVAPGTVVKDLRRHRMCTTIEQKLLVSEIGYRPKVFDAPEFLELNNLMDQIYLLSRSLYTGIAQFDEDVAQYALLQGNMTKWVVKMNLRSLFQQVELRTSSQGATDYREIMMSVAIIAMRLYPNLAKHLLVDFDSYEFARRGEDVTAEKRLARLQSGLQVLNQN